jgi:hypothetical protein
MLAAIAVLPAAPATAIHWTNIAQIGETVPGIAGGEVFSSLLPGVLDVSGGRVVLKGGWGNQPQESALFAWTDTSGLDRMAPDASSISVAGKTFSLAPGLWDVGGTGVVTVDRLAEFQACPARESLWPEEVTFAEDGAGGFAPVVAPGMPVPGIESGWMFSAGTSTETHNNYRGAPASNANGDLAFFAWIRRAAYLCDPDPSTPYATALFGPDGGGSFTLVALDEDPAPGAGDTAALELNGPVALNGVGEIAFDATVRLGPTGPSVPAIYRWDAANGLRLVTLSYDPGGSGWWAHGFFRLSEAGHVAFVNASGTALFVEDVANGIEERVAAGDPAPGLPAGYTFAVFARPPGFLDPPGVFSFAVNALGDVAFSGRAEFAGGGEPSQFGVWGPDASGALVLRMAEGQDAPGIDGATIFVGAPPVLFAMSDQRELLIRALVVAPSGVHVSRVYYLIDADGNAPNRCEFGRPARVTPGVLESMESLPALDFDADLTTLRSTRYQRVRRRRSSTGGFESAGRRGARGRSSARCGHGGGSHERVARRAAAARCSRRARSDARTRSRSRLDAGGAGGRRRASRSEPARVRHARGRLGARRRHRLLLERRSGLLRSRALPVERAGNVEVLTPLDLPDGRWAIPARSERGRRRRVASKGPLLIDRPPAWTPAPAPTWLTKRHSR